MRFIPNIPQFGGGGGPPPPPVTSRDRFAPKYLVGNVPAGDSPISYNSGGFYYIPDIGDGAGIELALSYADPSSPNYIAVGDVWIRPGTYNLGAPTSPATVPLTIPQGVRVYGSGYGQQEGGPPFPPPYTGTVIVAKAGPEQDQSVFRMLTASQLEQLLIVVPVSEGTSIGKNWVVGVDGSGANTIRNVGILTQMTTSPSTAVLRYGIYIETSFSSTVSLENLILGNSAKDSLTPTDSAMIYQTTGNVSARNVTTRGGACGIEVANSASRSEFRQTGLCAFRGDDIFIESATRKGVYYHEIATEFQVPGCVKLHRSKISGFQQPDQALDVGVLLDSGDGHTLSDCVIDMGDSNGAAAVELTASTGPCVNVNVTGCTILARAAGVRMQPVANNAIRSVSVTDCEIYIDGPFYPRTGIDIRVAREVTVTSNAVTVKGNVNEGNISATKAIYIAASKEVVVGNNVIKTSVARSNEDVAIEAESTEDGDIQRITISDNSIETSAQYAILVQGGGDNPKCVVISDNNIRTFTDNDTLRPNDAIFASVYRTAITGNVIDHGTDNRVAPIGYAINAVGNRFTVSGNTIEMSVGSTSPAILVQGVQTACTGNAIGLDNQLVIPAIVLTNTSSNCTAVSNTCGTVPPVSDFGAFNEIAHNT